MSRPCTICSLPDQRRRKLERLLMTQNNTQASLASGHSRFALGRHRKHMSAAMSAAYSVAEDLAGALCCPLFQVYVVRRD